MNTALAFLLQQHKPNFHPVIKIDGERNKILPLDFTRGNVDITEELIADTQNFSGYIDRILNLSLIHI